MRSPNTYLDMTCISDAVYFVYQRLISEAQYFDVYVSNILYIFTRGDFTVNEKLDNFSMLGEH